MKRLTEYTIPEIGVTVVSKEKYKRILMKEKPSVEKVYNRLKKIEDILGDDYDLDRLRELAQADKEGRCAVLPCKPGDRILIDGRKAIIVEFFGYETERYFHAQFYDNMQYIDIPFEEIGKTVFITYKEAEAAPRREQDG